MVIQLAGEGNCIFGREYSGQDGGTENTIKRLVGILRLEQTVGMKLLKAGWVKQFFYAVATILKYKGRSLTAVNPNKTVLEKKKKAEHIIEIQVLCCQV